MACENAPPAVAAPANTPNGSKAIRKVACAEYCIQPYTATLNTSIIQSNHLLNCRMAITVTKPSRHNPKTRICWSTITNPPALLPKLRPQCDQDRQHILRNGPIFHASSAFCSSAVLRQFLLPAKSPQVLQKRYQPKWAEYLLFVVELR